MARALSPASLRYREQITGKSARATRAQPLRGILPVVLTKRFVLVWAARHLTLLAFPACSRYAVDFVLAGQTFVFYELQNRRALSLQGLERRKQFVKYLPHNVLIHVRVLEDWMPKPLSRAERIC